MGFRINWGKYLVIGLNCNSSTLACWALVVRCEVSSFSSYLGPPIGHNPRSFDDLESHCEKDPKTPLLYEGIFLL